MRFRILTAVWGAAFAERFARFTLRSLAAPGNLIDLARRHDVVYEICAPPEEIESIERQPIFKELSRAVTIRFHALSLDEFAASNAMAHWDLWSTAVERARADDAYVILVASDQVFARGTLLRWAELLEQGNLAVFCTGFQVALETVTDDIAKRFPGETPIDLPVAELQALIFCHLHPIMISMFRNSPRWIPHPEWHLRAAPGQGLVQRVLSSHAYAFHPNRIRMTDNFCPVEKFDRVAFEPSCFFGVEPLLKQLGYYLRPWQMNDTALSYYGVWAEQFIARANLIENKIAYQIPIGEPMPATTLRRLQLEGDFYVGQMQASRALVRIWRALQDAGLYQAARWLAAAHLHGRLRRRLPARGPVTLFVPAEELLERIDAGEASRLLAGGGVELIATLRAHVAPGRHSLSPGDRLAQSAEGPIKTGDGRHYSRSQTGPVAVLRGPIQVDDVEIYVIDQVLAPGSLRPQAAASALHRYRRETIWLMRRGREKLLALLGRSRRLYDMVLQLRELWFSYWHDASSTAPAVVDPDALALYRRALASRALQAMREMCDFFERDVLGDAGIEFPPRARLAELGIVNDDEVKLWLLEALRKSPGFAEAWLELGYLCQESGDTPGAIDAFARTQALPAVLGRLTGQPDLCAIAATEAAKLLDRSGRSADVLAMLDATPSQRFVPWSFHLWRARALLNLGRADEALAAFEQCLRWQSVEPRLTALLPGDFDALRTSLQSQPAAE